MMNKTSYVTSATMQFAENPFLKLVGILWNRTSVEGVDKLSSTFVDLSGLKGNWKTCTYMESKCLLSMLRCMLGSVKSENPMGKGKIGNEKLKNKI